MAFFVAPVTLVETLASLGLHAASCPQMLVRGAGAAMGGRGGLKAVGKGSRGEAWRTSICTQVSQGGGLRRGVWRSAGDWMVLDELGRVARVQ